MNYAQQRLDPRWQRRRLDILSRDNFTCQECGDKSSTLNVHHRWYVSGRMMWEYPDVALQTLCRPCHEEIDPSDGWWEWSVELCEAVDGNLIKRLIPLSHNLGVPQSDILEALIYWLEMGQMDKEDIVSILDSRRKMMEAIQCPN